MNRCTEEYGQLEYECAYITGADLENFSRGGPTLSKKKPITQTQKILNTSYLIVIFWIDSVWRITVEVHKYEK